jgi:hypothetical protein
MKRCPKCSRTFPDENQKFCTVDGGLLIAAQPAFDPNVTIRATATEIGADTFPGDKATSRELPDINATVFEAASAPTEVLPRTTGPTSAPTTGGIREPAAAAPTTTTTGTGAPVSAALPATAPKKKSKLPWILGGLALLLLLGAGGAAGLFFFVIQPRLEALSERRGVEVTPTETPKEVTNNEETNKPTPEPSPETSAFEPPPNTTQFVNSKDNLDGKLAEHYIDFSFYYPNSWQVDAKAGVPGASNFAKVERRLPPDFTQENFAVGWYTSKGTFEADQSSFPQLVQLFSDSLEKNFPEYRKVSEGPTKINDMDAYEFRFVSVSKGTEKGDLQLWGRVVFLPTGVEGQATGATLIMLSTSLAPELSGVSDVGEKGEMPVILDSFRFGKG